MRKYRRPRDAQRSRVMRALVAMDVWDWQVFAYEDELRDYINDICQNTWVRQDFGKACCLEIAADNEHMFIQETRHFETFIFQAEF